MNFMCFFIAYLQIARLRNQGISKNRTISNNLKREIVGYSAKQTDNCGFFCNEKAPGKPGRLTVGIGRINISADKLGRSVIIIQL